MQLRKQKIGNILYWFFIGMLLAYVQVLLLRPGNLRAPMSDSDAAIWSILFAAAMATYVIPATAFISDAVHAEFTRLKARGVRFRGEPTKWALRLV